MTATKKPTFEEALAKLETASESLQKDQITLEEALRQFEAGIEHYNTCNQILQNARQKIETYTK